MYVILNLCILFFVFHLCRSEERSSDEGYINFQQNPAPDGHRCGICPTYFQKICAYDEQTRNTFIYDNHCIMDLYNCLHSTRFEPVQYDKCLYFANFAYVHGYKYDDLDYGEAHFEVKQTKKNPDFI